MCTCTGKEKANERKIKLTVPSDIITIKYNWGDSIKKEIFVDICLVQEIYDLWQKGIHTTGCCCGHSKKDEAWVGVINEDIDKMQDLGYHHFAGLVDREDLFIPKSIYN